MSMVRVPLSTHVISATIGAVMPTSATGKIASRPSDTPNEGSTMRTSGSSELLKG